MKNKFYYNVLALLIASMLAVTSFGPASAKTQHASMAAAAAYKCNFSPLKPSGPAPLKVTFYADYNGSDVESYLWSFGDRSSDDSAVGPVAEHVFKNADTLPHIKLQVWFVDGSSIQCSTYGDVRQPSTTVSKVTPTPTPNAYGNSNSGSAANMGNNNFAPVINGNSNQININPDPIIIVITPPATAATTTPAPTVTPVAPIVPDDNSCYGNCASNGGTIIINPTPATQSSAVVKTMPTNFWAMFFYTIFDGISSPFENWKTWLVENR